jgi:alcohol dehydrogenase (NADP+)
LEIGSGVTRHKIGDAVAVGPIIDSRQHCDQCHRGEEQMCREWPTMAYNLGGRACIAVNSDELPYTTDFVGLDKSPALVNAGLLASRQTKMLLAGGQSTTGTEFSLTDLGKQYLVKNRPGFAKTIALSF